METEQTQFWKGKFGKSYTDRNTLTHEDWNRAYVDKYGMTKLALNEKLMDSLPRDSKILEVGCNTGQQLEGLQKMGFTQLYGIELQWYAVKRAQSMLDGVNILQGSGFDLPFRDNYFDLVCTNGVLIHISPNDLPRIISEMYRCSRRYIMGFEYYAEEMQSINYRGNDGFMWKADYAQLFCDYLPNLQIAKKEVVPYISKAEQGNEDCLYLLEKS